MRVPWYLMAKGKGGGGYKTASGPIVSVNDALAAPLRSLLVNIEPVQAGSGDPSPDNVRPISGWSAVNVWVKPTYDPTANPTATIQLGDTYYGGTLDVTNGVLTVDRAMVDMGTLTWNYYSDDRNGFYAAVSGRKYGSGIGVISSMYKYIGTTNNSNVLITMTTGTMAAHRTNTSVLVKDTRYTDATTFTAAMSGVQLVYELGTPITIQLTPTEVTTLLGQNNVWADTGDVTVEYLSAGGANPDLMKLAVAFMGRK